MFVSAHPLYCLLCSFPFLASFLAVGNFFVFYSNLSTAVLTKLFLCSFLNACCRHYNTHTQFHGVHTEVIFYLFNGNAEDVQPNRSHYPQQNPTSHYYHFSFQQPYIVFKPKRRKLCCYICLNIYLFLLSLYSWISKFSSRMIFFLPEEFIISFK